MTLCIITAVAAGNARPVARLDGTYFMLDTHS